MYALTRLPVSVSLLVVYALCLAGCGFMSSNGEEEPSSDTASTAEVVHVSSQNGSVDHRVQEAESDLASPDTRNAEDESTTSVEEFVPPFPNRTSMFSRPNAQKAAGLVRKRQEDRGGDLQLKGFVNVGQPRAMLQVDGKLWIAAAGDSLDDLQIVSVAPPSVSVARGGANIDLSLRQDR